MYNTKCILDVQYTVNSTVDCYLASFGPVYLRQVMLTWYYGVLSPQTHVPYAYRNLVPIVAMIKANTSLNSIRTNYSRSVPSHRVLDREAPMVPFDYIPGHIYLVVSSGSE